MPIAELEALVSEKAMSFAGGGSIPEGGNPAMGGAAPAAAALEGIDPGLVEAASMTMVAMGVLAQPTAEMSPAFVEAVQAAVDQLYPGLFDVSDPAQMKEALNELATGGAAAAAGGSGGEPGVGVGDGGAGGDGPSIRVPISGAARIR